MANFIKIKNNFINLNSVKAFKIRGYSENSIKIWVEYNDGKEDGFVVEGSCNSSLAARAFYTTLYNTHNVSCQNFNTVFEELIEIEENNAKYE